jgi:hypothetical protein
MGHRSREGAKRLRLRHHLTAAVEQTVRASKLSPVIEGYGVDVQGSSIPDLLEFHVRQRQLDDRDLEALSGWARLLCQESSMQRVPVLEKGLDLCTLVSRYRPGFTDVDLDRFSAYQSREETRIRERLRHAHVSSRPSTNRVASRLRWIFAPDSLADLVHKEDRQLVLDPNSSALFEGRSEWLDDVVRGLSAPFFNETEIEHPYRLIRKLDLERVRFLAEPSEDRDDLAGEFFELFAGCRGHQPPDREAELRRHLVRFLNLRLRRGFFDPKLFDVRDFTPRLRTLAEPESWPRLRGRDLVSFNRRVMEHWLGGLVCRSEIEALRDRLVGIIKDDWLKDHPAHFLSLDSWAVHYLTLPEFEDTLQAAIRFGSPDMNWLHEHLARLYSREGYEQEAADKLEAAMKMAEAEGPAAMQHYFPHFLTALNRSGDFDRARKAIRKAHTRQLLSTVERDAEITRTDDEQIAAGYGRKWTEQLPVVSPLEVEVAEDLVPFVEGRRGELDPIFRNLVDDMRERVLKEFGVRVPGLQFRPRELPGQRLFGCSAASPRGTEDDFVQQGWS